MKLTTPGTEWLQQTLFPADGLAAAVLQQQHDVEPQGDLFQAVQAIRDIAEGVCERLDSGAALGDTLFTLNDHLFNVLGFHCAPASHALPRQSLLQRVLHYRSAEPLALGVLYISIGRWLGLPLRGSEFPGRFLVHYHDEQGEVIIDPAAGGVQLQEEDLRTLLRRRFGGEELDDVDETLFNELDDDDLALRLLRRLKQAYLLSGDAARALKVQQKIMQQLPDAPGGYRDRGRLYEMLGCHRAAARDYSRYIDLAPDAYDVLPLSQRLPQLLRGKPVLH